jgi:hypothetical protein
MTRIAELTPKALTASSMVEMEDAFGSSGKVAGADFITLIEAIYSAVTGASLIGVGGGVMLDAKLTAITSAIAALNASTVVPAIGAVALAANDFVNLYDNAGVLSARKATALDPTKFADGFVLTASTIGQPVSVIWNGENPVTITTSAADVWLSDTTPGGYVTTAPSGTGSIIQRLGRAAIGQGILFSQNPRIQL